MFISKDGKLNLFRRCPTIRFLNTNHLVTSQSPFQIRHIMPTSDRLKPLKPRLPRAYLTRSNVPHLTIRPHHTQRLQGLRHKTKSPHKTQIPILKEQQRSSRTQHYFQRSASHPSTPPKSRCSLKPSLSTSIYDGC